jgi:hypothetical protein
VRTKVMGTWTRKQQLAVQLSLGAILLCRPHPVRAQAPPAFKCFKMKTGEGLVSLVVPPATTDAQMETLLRHIRSKVQQGKFVDLGIRHPTSKRFGKLGYDAGIISIYRGEKCANEQFLDEIGPCGYGEHDAGSYQWGVDGDPKKDGGVLRQANGEMRKIF